MSTDVYKRDLEALLARVFGHPIQVYAHVDADVTSTGKEPLRFPAATHDKVVYGLYAEALWLRGWPYVITDVLRAHGLTLATLSEAQRDELAASERHCPMRPTLFAGAYDRIIEEEEVVDGMVETWEPLYSAWPLEPTTLQGFTLVLQDRDLQRVWWPEGELAAQRDIEQRLEESVDKWARRVFTV
jgi:hypothetical protein